MEATNLAGVIKIMRHSLATGAAPAGNRQWMKQAVVAYDRGDAAGALALVSEHIRPLRQGSDYTPVAPGMVELTESGQEKLDAALADI